MATYDLQCALSVGVAFARDISERQKDAVALCSLDFWADDSAMERQEDGCTANSESGRVVAVHPGETPRELASIEHSVPAIVLGTGHAVCLVWQDGRIFPVAPDGRGSLVSHDDGVPVR